MFVNVIVSLIVSWIVCRLVYGNNMHRFNWKVLFIIVSILVFLGLSMGQP